MFAYLKGMLEHIKEHIMVIDVNGVGYKVHTSLSTVEKLPALHQNVKVYIYLHVKEDAMDLFGFIDEEELSVFELLIGVSGVGPKAALAILSTISPAKFALAVASSDAKTIIKAPGVGNKLAQRIILELKDKIKSEDLAASYQEEQGFIQENDHPSEAVHALAALGYSYPEANRAVQAVKNDGVELEEIIKLALKKLMK
ncbi:Holliday junction branch migration protein RuvA [Petroclostridium sp. X23]|uniref:Holliday junction branch migration protein RuvA n=1 Tax=Petroclostridium sp. X23 TaxID=3045146 RepID=UPI0024AD7EFF|nr:Holliday junction branch migration protein RuvA [Petroclostridium sp. X23]WHH60192.1 Holliday junction branch migration protein RuvA [Petroclostridium sp. X23]